MSESRLMQPSAAARAEAAAWVARLHGPNRTQDVEAGLRRWLADDPEHAAAFELITDTWDKSAGLKRRIIEHVSSWERPGFRISFSRAALVTAVTIVLAVIGTLLFLRGDGVSTAVGERRVVVLDDGTRVHLNTDSQVRVRYDKTLRRVSLERGEALFEVAKHADWPFIVTAGGREIRALGTEFLVRRGDQSVAVTLVEGKVSVSPVSGRPATTAQGSAAPPLNTPAGSAPRSEVVTLAPGDRLTFTDAGSANIDHPSMERVTAWERGEVTLDDTSLADAAAEMNRYSREKILIDDTVRANRVSGIFQAGDSMNFALAVARTHHLKVLRQPRGIVLVAEDR